MNRNKLYLLLQSLVCVLLAVLLIVTVIGIYRGGAAAREENPLGCIFSREIVAARFGPLAPLFLAALALSAGGLLLGVKDETGLGPVKSGRAVQPARGGKTLRTVLLAAAVLLMAAGVINGSARDVFSKAVKICTECVGLG